MVSTGRRSAARCRCVVATRTVRGAAAAVSARAIVASGLLVGGLSLGVVPTAVLPTAGAATCTSAGGVSVVVDYRELGGSTVTACAPDGGGKSAAAIFASVGVSLSYATRQPGFVCRVNGVPTSDPCVNASPSNAYWGLWWADGSKESWTYSSFGVGSLTVPAGGSVGWSWQQDRAGSDTAPPSVAPRVTSTTASASPTPSPTVSPTPSSSPSPTASSSTSSASSPTSSPSGEAGQTASPGSSRQVAPSRAPSASEPPVALESPGDSSNNGQVGETPDDPTLAAESPADSSASAASEAGSQTGDEPAKVPAAITWSVLGLLAIAIAGSAVVARRRRGSHTP